MQLSLKIATVLLVALSLSTHAAVIGDVVGINSPAITNTHEQGSVK